MLSTTSLLSPPFSPQTFSFPGFTRPPPSSPTPTPQVLLESALKHWSRVKRYVAQDGSG